MWHQRCCLALRLSHPLLTCCVSKAGRHCKGCLAPTRPILIAGRLGGGLRAVSLQQCSAWHGYSGVWSLHCIPRAVGQCH